jgi:hypothetical protein
MKNIALLSTLTLSFTLLTACGGGGSVRSDSIAQRGIGADTALINKGRGAKQAQVSAAQAKQYDRQRSEGDKEMDYQERQDERASKQRNRNIGTLSNILGVFR